MASLQNAQIDQTYQALLKTGDNGAITGTPKAITDGAGAATNLEMSNTATNFVSGTVDFTGATVSGLPAGGAAGLESGTGTSSMQSAAALTTTAANASGNNSIALGDNAIASNGESIAIGKDAIAPGQQGIAIGNGATCSAAGEEMAIGLNATAAGNAGTLAIGRDSLSNALSSTAVGRAADAGGTSSVALGHSANSAGEQSVALGNNTDATESLSTAVGYQAEASAQGAVAVGQDSTASGLNSIAIGKNALASGGESMAYGDDAQATQTSAASFGQYAEATATYAIAFGRTSAASGDGAVAFGQQTSAAQAGAVAMGRQVTADTADTTHVRALKIVAPDGAALGGNGITMLSPDGTAGEITLTNDSKLAIDGTAIGGDVFTLPRVGGITQSSGCDVIQASVLIPANTFQAGDMWQLNGADSATGSTGFVYSAYWISTTGTVGQSATEEMNLGQQESQNAAWSRGYQKTIYVGTQDGTGIGSELVCSGCPSDVDGTNNGGIITKAVDWTSDLYLVSRVCVDNSGATYVNHGATLRKIN